jgi:glycosyltransferase involved in cell wall biosynthesis
MISVVCPFYNEEAILAKALPHLLGSLDTLDEPFEVIVVDDGSTDGGRAIAAAVAAEDPRLRVAGYDRNRGRGYAIRAGIAAATGEVVVTTEIDLSWGDDIVHRLVAAWREDPKTDIVIASPHLPGGGYRNVPQVRVWLSSLGNRIIRAGLAWGITMNTGMTRLYRRERFLTLPLDQDEKEQHLEILEKALAFGWRIREIPALLEWRHDKLAAPGKRRRNFGPTVVKLVRTHLSFAVATAPFRLLYPVAVLLLALASGFFGAAVWHLFTPTPSIYLLLVAMLLGLFAFLIFGLGALAQQARETRREIWRMRSEMRDPQQTGSR